MESVLQRSRDEASQLLLAMRISLAVGLAFLVIKASGVWITGSVALLGDAAESVVHVFAVGFALFALHVTLKPADQSHPYGHAKIAFFSSGFEGAMILMASIFVGLEAARDIASGQPRIQSPVIALWITAVVVVTTGVLGLHLLRLGKRTRSIVLEANGKHVLTDCYTSIGVLVGLFLTWLTGWNYWDPVCALLVALNMFCGGINLVWRSFNGLMDRADPSITRQLTASIERETSARGLDFHAMRHRDLGDSHWVDMHLLFPANVSLRDAHRTATEIERAIAASFDHPLQLTTHLESLDDHDMLHRNDS